MILFKRKKKLLQEIEWLKKVINEQSNKHEKKIEEIEKNNTSNLIELLKLDKNVEGTYNNKMQGFSAFIKVDPFVMNSLTVDKNKKAYYIDHLCRIMKDQLMNAVFYKI